MLDYRRIVVWAVLCGKSWQYCPESVVLLDSDDCSFDSRFLILSTFLFRSFQRSVILPNSRVDKSTSSWLSIALSLIDSVNENHFTGSQPSGKARALDSRGEHN